MKIIKFQNSVLENYITETAILRKAVSVAGTSLELTLDDNSQLENSDLVIFGQLGDAKTEKAQINAVVSVGSIIQVDALKHIHKTGVKVQRTLYDQIKIYHDTDQTGASKSLLDTVDISFDQEFTTYADSVNTSGYVLFSLYNSVTADESGLSVAIPYTALDSGTKSRIRDFVKEFYPKQFSDTVFDLILETAQMELSADNSFKFKEKTWTFNTVADQKAYPFADNELDDLGQVLVIKYDDDEIKLINAPFYARITEGDDNVGTPTRAFIWANEIKFDPTPSEVKEIEIMGYKTLGALADEDDESAISIPAYLGFKILQDFWAGSDNQKASFYGGRANQIKEAMRMDNDKHFESDSALNTPPRRSGLVGEITIT